MGEFVARLPVKAGSETAVFDAGSMLFPGVGFDYAAARLVLKIVDGGDIGTHLSVDFVQAAGFHGLGWAVGGQTRDLLSEFQKTPVGVSVAAYSETGLVRRSVETTDVELWGKRTPISMPYHYTFTAIDSFHFHVLAQTCVVRSFTAPDGATRGQLFAAADELGPFDGWDPNPVERRLAFDCRFEVPDNHLAYFADLPDPVGDM